jgi:hypothetical protein
MLVILVALIYILFLLEMNIEHTVHVPSILKSSVFKREINLLPIPGECIRSQFYPI